MAIVEWDKEERPRERLLARGPESLTDTEILSLTIGAGTEEKSALEISRELITVFGGLRGVINTEQDELKKISGLGPVTISQISVAMELGRRYLEEKMQDKAVMTDPESVNDYLGINLRDREREVFAVLFLDNRHQVIKYEEIFQGTVDRASVHPREIVKRVLHHNAAAVIIAHNHPSGVAEPSPSDKDITKKIEAALHQIDVRLLDHIVIGDGEYVSFGNRGLISEKKPEQYASIEI